MPMPDSVRADVGVSAPRPGPGAWAKRAACRGMDTALFFPGQGDGATLAKETCAGCPVRAECLEHAVAVGEAFGIWGGLNEKGRRRRRGTAA
jgi:WhiB family transcriptional regulator, redox-sensing transcriptional regulator